MNWISVEERLPQPVRQFERFIVATNQGVGVATFDAINKFGAVTLSGGTQYPSLKISHWMPLPDAP